MSNENNYLYAIHDKDLVKDKTTGLLTYPINTIIKRFEQRAFSDCTTLQFIDLSKFEPAYKNIPWAFFSGCTNLIKVVWPHNLKTIAAWAFKECKNLSLLDTPHTLQTIELGAFYGCCNLRTIILRENLNCIEDRVFAECPNIKVIIIDTLDEKIYERIKAKIPNNLKVNVMPYNVWLEVQGEINRVKNTPAVNPLYRFFNRQSPEIRLENGDILPTLSHPVLNYMNHFNGVSKRYTNKINQYLYNTNLPQTAEEKIIYLKNLRKIALECIQKATEYNDLRSISESNFRM
ncbi:Uncharacterised protein [Legionella beliardensis]|uniref:Leucine-rich repeat domain-containing protein n=1 Tax=Legionella beliardensis TaxID=91822 RepID=A0A378I3A3_9GAMM|nr:leucine-rich repeat domain-containing protein [Legionella beliardensis]STX29195.1 Uncharacterised protein [Legionella beliardensis]